MSWTLTIFIVVYIGLILGRLPGLKVDRAGIALLGAIALVATGDIPEKTAWGYIDYDTMSLLFGLMLVSSQLHTAGFFGWVSGRFSSLKMGPTGFLAVLIAVTGFLGALLTNDVICLAMAPVLVEVCRARRLNPIPFLLALACSANVGSTATIMGSPQNMLIGESLHLPFSSFLLDTAPPALVSMGVIWACVAVIYRGRWTAPETTEVAHPETIPLHTNETVKGLLIVAGLLALFLLTDWPHSLIALGAGGLLLMNRHFRSKDILEGVEWQLLILFMGLFIVNGALQQTHLPDRWMMDLKAMGMDLESPAWLFVVTALLSDIVSNVPSVMLLLPYAKHPLSGPAMALASGFSSNLIVIGSLANIIVVDAAAKAGIRISFGEFAKTGIPVTILSLLLAFGWLWIRA